MHLTRVKLYVESKEKKMRKRTEKLSFVSMSLDFVNKPPLSDKPAIYQFPSGVFEIEYLPPLHLEIQHKNVCSNYGGRN